MAMLHVGTTSSAQPGGMELQIANLGQVFQSRGWAVQVLFPEFAESGRLARLFSEREITLGFAPSSLNYDRKHSLRHVTKLAQMFRQRTPEDGIIHLHYPESFLSAFDMAAVRLARRRCFASLHGVSRWEEAGSRKRRITRFVSHLCEAITVNSRAVRQAVQAAGVPDHLLHIVPCGVSESSRPASTRYEARERLHLPQEGFVIASAGRLVARKRIADVIQAVQNLRPAQTPVTLLVAGDGPERVRLEALATDLNVPVRFLGHVSRMEDFYAAANVFVLPSEEEAFGLVYVEAALHGIPSVAVAQGGVPDVITAGETGILLELGDTVGLTRTLEDLRRQPERCVALGEAARHRARTCFTLTRTADRFEALYTSASRKGESRQ